MFARCRSALCRSSTALRRRDSSPPAILLASVPELPRLSSESTSCRPRSKEATVDNFAIPAPQRASDHRSPLCFGSTARPGGSVVKVLENRSENECSGKFRPNSASASRTRANVPELSDRIFAVAKRRSLACPNRTEASCALRTRSAGRVVAATSSENVEEVGVAAPR